ncbi:hypothetical protein Y1Q_0002725 [Alligator mississippiensis]|uniref:Uncharacterized protein n=1 Tax=Alligator mississippiensis TaxID=8496 RepID=A0A151NYX6_ALLMI|nr:hypothetical protein Y1Q_0002725 [Alligator mississippiensis]
MEIFFWQQQTQAILPADFTEAVVGLLIPFPLNNRIGLFVDKLFCLYAGEWHKIRVWPLQPFEENCSARAPSE